MYVNVEAEATNIDGIPAVKVWCIYMYIHIRICVLTRVCICMYMNMETTATNLDEIPAVKVWYIYKYMHLHICIYILVCTYMYDCTSMYNHIHQHLREIT